MSYEMSLAWLLLSSSIQRSLLPWESAVWTKRLMEGLEGVVTADKAHPASASCHLWTGEGKPLNRTAQVQSPITPT